MTDQDGCGLAKLGRTWSPSGFKMTDFIGTPEWACGAVRFVMSAPDLWFARTSGRIAVNPIQPTTESKPTEGTS
jgi:hypothetical protein